MQERNGCMGRASELGNAALVSYEDMLKAMECR